MNDLQRWQTYSDAGNYVMERLFNQLANRIRTGDVTRKALPKAVAETFDQAEQELPGQGYWDTEVQYAMQDRLNTVLKEEMYLPIERWDW